MDPAAPSLAELLAHAGWARQLARELVADRSRAEDVVQETWLAALEAPPAHGANPRGWLRSVLRNTARQLGRGDARRARRELERAAPEALPAADELVAAVEWQQRIAAAVLALDEPYRETLILRFYRDLAPQEIARAQGVPDGTVRSRLKRGLDELRARFDREAGERDVWCALLVRWAGRDASRATPVATGAGAWLALKLLLALFVVSGGALVGYRELAHDSRAQTALEPALVTDAEPTTGAPAHDASLAPTTTGEREPAPEAHPESARDAAPDVPAYIGHVRAPDGAPIAGATLKLYPNKSWPRPTPIGVGTSDADGRFRIVAEPTSSTYIMIGAEADGFQGMTMDPVVPESEIPIQLTWIVEVSGVVRDARSGAPLAGVELTGDGAERVVSDEHGNYRFGFPSGLQRSLRARLAGYAATQTAYFVRGHEAQHFDLELAPAPSLEVEVVDLETRAPLAAVAVSYPYREQPWTRTDEHGRFTTWVAPGQRVELELTLESYWPLTWDWTPDPGALEVVPRLALVRQAWIDGRITDEHGAPLADVWVYALGEDTGRQREAKPDELQTIGTPGRVHHGPRRPGDDEVQSDRDGRFRLPILAGGAPFRVHAGRKGFVDAEPGPFVFTRSSDHQTLELELAPAAAIHGQVRHEDKPWHGRIEYRSPSGATRGGAWVEGKYALDDVPAGTWRFALVDTDDRQRTDLPSFDITVEAGRTYEHDLAWGDAPALGTISGRVRSASGPLPSSVFVGAEPLGDPRAEGDVAAPGADGSFVLHVRRGSSYDVRAWVSRIESLRSEASVAACDTEGVELVLPEIGTLRLCLIDRSTRRPIQPRERFLTDALSVRAAREEHFRDEHVEVDLQGCIELVLAIGLYDVRLDLTREGYRPCAMDALTVASASSAAPHVLELERGIEARIQLSGSAPGGSSPLADHLVFLIERAQLGAISGPYPAQGPPTNHRITGICMHLDDPSLMQQMLSGDFYDTGIALLHGLAPGHYFLKSYPDDFVFDPAEFDVPGPERADLTSHWRPR